MNRSMDMGQMKISFLVNEVAGGWESTDTRLGGTERGLVEWAEELAKRGHLVGVFRNGRDSLRSDSCTNNVWYYPRELYGKGEVDVTINIKSPEMDPIGPTLFYTNDIDADKQDLSRYDGIIHISNWARQNIPVNNPNVFIVPHGYDPKTHHPDIIKVRKQCLYSSSPDRGLDVLLRAWPKVLEAHPDATLKVTYGAEPMDIPGVEFLGDVSEEEMAKLYRESEYWCHPCIGIELQCIAGLKAQASGCIPVIIPTMALKETVHDGYFAKTPEVYAETLIYALDGYENNEIREKLNHYRYPTIEVSTDKLLEIIGTIGIK